MQEVKSSNLFAVGYENGTLKIQFKAKDGLPGPIYHYADVPKQVFHDLLTAESKGGHFMAHIRKQYKGVKQ